MGNIINKEKLLAGVVFGDAENDEYVFMPGGELGSPFPLCVFERNAVREDISFDEAAELIAKLHLRALSIPPFSKI